MTRGNFGDYWYDGGSCRSEKKPSSQMSMSLRHSSGRMEAGKVLHASPRWERPAEIPAVENLGDWDDDKGGNRCIESDGPKGRSDRRGTYWVVGTGEQGACR